MSNLDPKTETVIETIRRRLQQPLPTLIYRRICGIEVEITQEMSDKYDQFLAEHRLPLEKQGAIGGEWTLCITPTSLGHVYVVKHANGAELNITPFEVW